MPIKLIIFIIALLITIGGCQRPAVNRRNLATEYYVNAMVSKAGKLDDRAIEELKESVRVDPEFMLAHSMMGQLYKDQGHYELAAQAYEKACALNRWNFTNHFDLGEIYFTLEKFDLAKNKFGRAVLIDPDHSQANFNLGACYYETNDLNNALRYYGRASELDPKNDLILALMGDLYGQLKNPQQALAEYRKSLDINPNQPQIMINMAKIYLITGSYDPAKLLLKKAIELQKNDPHPHFCLGYIALQQDEPQNAWQHYHQALALDDKHYQAMNGLAVANILIHRQDQKDPSRIKSAINFWQRSLAINPAQQDIENKIQQYQKILEEITE